MSYKQGVVLVVDDDDNIISEFECDFSYAIQSYMGKRDEMGRRYIIKTYGESIIPYKRKAIKFAVIDRLRGSFEASKSEPIHH